MHNIATIIVVMFEKLMSVAKILIIFSPSYTLRLLEYKPHWFPIMHCKKKLEIGVCGQNTMATSVKAMEKYFHYLPTLKLGLLQWNVFLDLLIST